MIVLLPPYMHTYMHTTCLFFFGIRPHYIIFSTASTIYTPSITIKTRFFRFFAHTSASLPQHIFIIWVYLLVSERTHSSFCAHFSYLSRRLFLQEIIFYEQRGVNKESMGKFRLRNSRCNLQKKNSYIFASTVRIKKSIQT